MKTIGYGAFKNTSSLKVIKIVESLTQSEGINHEAEFLAGSAVQSYTIPYGSFNRFNSQSFWASSVNEIIFCDKLQDGSTSNFSLPVAVSCPPFRVFELEKLKGVKNTTPTPTPTPKNSLTPIIKKPIKIKCIKGKLAKTVTGINPKCPTGYKAKE